MCRKASFVFKEVNCVQIFDVIVVTILQVFCLFVCKKKVTILHYKAQFCLCVVTFVKLLDVQI